MHLFYVVPIRVKHSLLINFSQNFIRVLLYDVYPINSWQRMAQKNDTSVHMPWANFPQFIIV